MKEVRLGIIGMGPRGREGWFLKTSRHVPNCSVTAVCDKIRPLVEQSLASAEKEGMEDVKGYTDAAKMLKEAPIDAVAVVVEPESQPALIVAALEAGKHVICDVPLAYTLEECWQITLAVEKTGLKFQLAEQRTWTPFVLAWQQMVTDRTLGKVLYVEGQYLHGMGEDRFWLDSKTGRRLTWEEAKNCPDARKSRIWTMEHPITYHTTDLSPILRILDDRVTKVTCMSTRRQSYYYTEVPNPDIEVALMHTEKDTIIRLAMGFLFPTSRPFHWWRMIGAGGEVETNRVGDNHPIVRGQWWLANRCMASRSDVVWGYNDHHPQPGGAAHTGHGGLDYYPLADFVESILDDKEPLIGIYRATDIAAPGIIAAQSTESWQWLDVPDFRPGVARESGQLPS